MPLTDDPRASEEGDDDAGIGGAFDDDVNRVPRKAPRFLKASRGDWESQAATWPTVPSEAWKLKAA